MPTRLCGFSATPVFNRSKYFQAVALRQATAQLLELFTSKLDYNRNTSRSINVEGCTILNGMLGWDRWIVSGYIYLLTA